MNTFLVTKGMGPTLQPCSTDGSYPGAVLESAGDKAPFLEQMHGREASERYYREGLADNGISPEAKRPPVLITIFPIRYATIRFWNIRNTKKA